MKTKPLTFLLVLTFLFLFTSSCSDTLQDGNAAADRGDYKTAHRIYLKLAEKGNAKAQYKLYRLSADQGDAEAQYKLGNFYYMGKGVPQDYKEAVKWYRLAAEQGNAVAQFYLGGMYFDGLGVTQDHALAYMWLNNAGSNGDKDAVKNGIILEKEMTPEEIE